MHASSTAEPLVSVMVRYVVCAIVLGMVLSGIVLCVTEAALPLESASLLG